MRSEEKTGLSSSDRSSNTSLINTSKTNSLKVLEKQEHHWTGLKTAKAGQCETRPRTEPDNGNPGIISEGSDRWRNFQVRP